MIVQDVIGMKKKIIMTPPFPVTDNDFSDTCGRSFYPTLISCMIISKAQNISYYNAKVMFFLKDS